MAHSVVVLEFISQWVWRQCYPSEADVFGQNAFICQHLPLYFLYSRFSPCPSIWIPLGRRGGEGRRGLVSSLLCRCSPGGLGLVCDLVSHMIDTHLILLVVNIFQRNRGDSRGGEKRTRWKMGWLRREGNIWKNSICWPSYWSWVRDYS